MRSYDETFSRIIEKGDAILEQKRRRSTIIRRTVFSVSGLCAALIAGFGIWHSPGLRDGIDRRPEKPELSAAETSAPQTTAPAQTSAEPAVTSAPTKTTALTASQTAPAETTVRRTAPSADIPGTASREEKAPVHTTVAAQTGTTAVQTTAAVSTALPATVVTESPVQRPEELPEPYNSLNRLVLNPDQGYPAEGHGLYFRRDRAEALSADRHICEAEISSSAMDRSLTCQLYSIGNVPVNAAILAKYPETDDLYLFINSLYRPDDLAELISDLSLSRDALAGAEYYTSASEKSKLTVSEAGHIWSVITADTSAKNCWPEDNEAEKPRMMSDDLAFEAKLSSLGITAWISVNRYGYLTVNAGTFVSSFYVGDSAFTDLSEYLTPEPPA